MVSDEGKPVLFKSDGRPSECPPVPIQVIMTGVRSEKSSAKLNLLNFAESGKNQLTPPPDHP